MHDEDKKPARKDDPGSTNREYRDRLFKFIFGNPDNKQWTLSLYNAMNGTNYDNPDDILPSVAKCPKDILQAAKQPKAALRLCRGQYDVALAALCAAPPSLTADFKMSFRHFEIARSISQ